MPEPVPLPRTGVVISSTGTWFRKLYHIVCGLCGKLACSPWFLIRKCRATPQFGGTTYDRCKKCGLGSNFIRVRFQREMTRAEETNFSRGIVARLVSIFEPV